MRHSIVIAALFITLVAGLSGCQNTPWKAPLQTADFYLTDAVEIPTASSEPVQSASVQTGTTNPVTGTQTLPLAPELPKMNPMQGQIAMFQWTLAHARRDPSNAPWARQLSEHGTVLINMLCYDYFRSSSEQRQKNHYRKDLAGNVSTVIGTLLNLDGASNLVTGSVTAIAGGISTDFQNQDSHFLPAPDLAAVRKVVATAMDLQADELRALQEPTYSQVSVRLMRLAETCDFNGIRALVNQSTTEGAKNVKSDGAGNAMVSNAPLPKSQYSRAKAIQDSAFDFLAACQWDKAEQAFGEVEEVYPQFQASYEFWRVLRNASPGNERSALEAMLGAKDESTKGALAYLPKNARDAIESSNKGKCFAPRR